MFDCLINFYKLNRMGCIFGEEKYREDSVRFFSKIKKKNRERLSAVGGLRVSFISSELQVVLSDDPYLDIVE